MTETCILLVGYGWFAGIPEGETNNSEMIACVLGDTFPDKVKPEELCTVIELLHKQ